MAPGGLAPCGMVPDAQVWFASMHEPPMDGPLPVMTATGGTAQAMVVRDESDLERAVRGLGLAIGPTVLVLGGADGIDPRYEARLRQFFERVVVPAIAALGARAVTGGTDAGVMRIVGAANLAAATAIELIGVAPYARVLAPGSAGRMPLARGHRAFVLTPGADWGDESPLLHALARRLGGPCPPVLLVNGGEIARSEVKRARAAGSHLVVVAGSGRAADELAAERGPIRPGRIRTRGCQTLVRPSLTSTTGLSDWWTRCAALNDGRGSGEHGRLRAIGAALEIDMTTTGRGARGALLLVASLTLTACGGGGPSPAATTAHTTAPPAAPATSAPPPSLAPAEPSAAPRLKVVLDETKAISIAVPDGWSVASVRWYNGTEDRGPGLVASPDPVAFAAAFDGRAGSVPSWRLDGVFVGVSRSLADDLAFGNTYRRAIVGLARWHGGDEEKERGWKNHCLRGGASLYESDSGGPDGFVTDWHDCGGVGTLLLDVGATGPEGGYVAQALAVTPSGDVALDQASSILDSLSIDEAALGG